MKLNPHLHAPLRAVCALLIGLVVYYLDSSNFHFWILLTIVILLPTTTGATWTKATSRVIGTVFGVLFGFLLFVLIDSNVYLYAVLILLAIFATAYLSKINYTASMFFAGILVILGLSYFIAKNSMPIAWEFVLARLLDTVIGAAIVIFVAFFFWPERSIDKLKQATATAIQSLIHSFNQQFKVYSANIDYSNDNSMIDEFYQTYIAFMTIQLEMEKQPKKLLQHQLNVTAIAYNLLSAYNSLVSLHVNFPLIKKNEPLKQHLAVTLAPFYASFTQIDTFCENTEQDVSLLEKLNQLTEQYMQMVAQLRESFDLNKNDTNITWDISVSTLLINIPDIFIALEFVVMAYHQLTKEV